MILAATSNSFSIRKLGGKNWKRFIASPTQLWPYSFIIKPLRVKDIGILRVGYCFRFWRCKLRG